MALGARSISVLFSSGDGGVRGGHDRISQCNNNTFIATFPPSCPCVTSVGSTIGIGPETASDAVAGFLEQLPTDFEGVFNSNGRGYPDISIQGSRFEIVLGGKHTAESGTSASTPTVASIISLINDQLIAAGKPVLGFLNPFLYYYASTALTDITAGHNSGVCPVSIVAFDAGVGWEPLRESHPRVPANFHSADCGLAGSGTPIFDQLLAAAMGTAPESDTGALHTSGAVVDTASALSSDTGTGTDGSDGAVRKYAPIVIGLLSGKLLLLLILVILGVGVDVLRGGAVGRKYVPVRLGEEESIGKRYSD
ncbi:peptidase S8/S53 domain-containing protein [Mycena olivaceomarginata]|nr:peptidase S8/S53 domain-containing protein [Mycena olivaceomarginata]